MISYMFSMWFLLAFSLRPTWCLSVSMSAYSSSSSRRSISPMLLTDLQSSYHLTPRACSRLASLL